MKMLKNIGVSLAVIGLAAGQLHAANLGTGCLNLNYPGSAGAPSYVDANVTFSTGTLPSGVFDAFCANINRPVGPEVYSFTAWDITDPAVTTLGLVVDPSNLDRVEYIINQGYPGNLAADTTAFTSDDVQVAIWTLLDGVASLGLNQSALNFSQPRVDQILAEAAANGEGFVAACGQIKAYIFNPVGLGCAPVVDPDNAVPMFQNLIIGLPKSCPPPPLEDPVTLECVATQTGDVGQPYSAQMVADGGGVPIGQTEVNYTFALTGGSLPNGLTLDTDTGVISGIPTAAGTFTFTITVTDAVGNTGIHTATKQCSITIAPPPPPTLEVACASVATGRVGLVYNATIAVSGGVAPYSFSSTSLPSWLSLNPTTGALTGTPPSAGAFPFSVTVTDSAGGTLTQTSTVNCSVTVAPACTPVKVGCVADNTGVVGEAYSSTLSVSGGVAPYKFFVVSGSLPAGLTLNRDTGVISGTPTSAGFRDFVIKVVDSAAAACGCDSFDTVCCRITVAANCPPIGLSCVSTTTGRVGTAYTGSLTATGGVAPYTFSIVSGNLPPGLTLNPTSGTITGNPTSAGTFTFVAKVAGANYSACGCYGYKTVCCSIKIDPAPSTCVGLVSGDTATIGYWNGPNGQALIRSLNGGPTARNLGNWLAATYPHLWGANAGSRNLAGRSNDQVAAFFRAQFCVRGAKTEAQMLAAALAVYVTDSDLAGTVARASGFNVSSAGTGAKCYNVDCYGSCVGLTNNRSYTVSALLAQANSRKRTCNFNSGAFNCIFDGINRKGDRL
jgi:hypothetical protein